MSHTPHLLYQESQLENEPVNRTMKPTELVDELTYSSYRYNRQRSPGVTPKQWETIFSNVEAMEARFQNE